ncbi:MAG: nickel-responsive transcriptional regulator NikR [Candidatus Omnitrophica bacterium]|nr:nickel-responsive transcriptional regulator NikR [Candidatus Omnitrophota bacterium]MCA9415660.1 nickel-responsive transcriptional regulator NikR [Candidatus Omnitrophota bacterium]MCA9426416.1 nickel-responsive transcriptional regulator NikR [Candidatus Omnitrophota bacterium]MCA9431872.1 nickel-responsive transcriptional regulator NikR [Candidatus Omnitrophota bacterium]MCA9435259.1 nickel-responsive transcriptional regulator NikR [Candidatus Omnitrophota bacterium]
MERYTITISEELLEKFDTSIQNKGYSNRSEAIRDLVRDSLVDDEWAEENEKVAATVTLVYDHHTSDLGDKLTELQHHSANLVVAATHVHLDNDNCLEVIILRGKCQDVRHLAEKMIAIRGVKHGKIVHTTEGRSIA